MIISLHDLGIAHAGADYGIDGSAAPGRRAPGRVGSLVGPAFAVIDPGCARPPLERRRPMVVVALGGGPRDRLALRLARAIVARTRGVRVVVARGFMAPPAHPRLPRVASADARTGLADLLRHARVAVTAGGLTLAEAAACATPVVATAVVEAQRPTIRAFASRGAAIDGGRLTLAAVPAIADEVAALLADPARRTQMGRAGRRLVDGRGTERVATAIRAWIARQTGGAR
jgi:spore coat polysaccharide biosynthesis predicted glycosyltransferase SpsG